MTAMISALHRSLVLLLLLAAFLSSSAVAVERKQPNIIFILADDFGYGELGCYGQKLIQTPRIDRMAREGVRFTQFYSGATVCAPSRSVLMTGQHQGHTRVRGNAGKKAPRAQALRAEDMTVAKLLKDSGYVTGLVGKWGLGEPGSAESGLPRKQGFDYFFGYLNQHHAHNHFPDYLWRNETRVSLPNGIVAVGDSGAGYATNPVVFADDLFADEAIQFVEKNRERPFFLFWSMVIPHANNERTQALKDGANVPDYGPYADKDWPKPNKGHAAMITRMDGYVGRLLETLGKLNLSKDTLVIFSSDNGPHKESGHKPEMFNPSGPLRGYKRDLTDGGIRVPCVAWWPGRIKAGMESGHVGYFGDFMATCAELAGKKTPTGTDSISFLPALLSRRQKKHEFLYWEFHEKDFGQAVLYEGRWKGLRLEGPGSPLVVYDLSADIGETNNVAAQNPRIVSRMEDYLKTARSDSVDWPMPKSKTR